MNSINGTQNLPQITAAEALSHKTSTPTTVVIGPTSSGKSTFIYNLINSQVYSFISNGIGDKSQTTIIPSNFLLDSRIKDENHFAIKIESKRFSKDLIHVEIYEKIINLCLSENFCANEILSKFNGAVFEKILEPKSANYHLGSLKDKILLADFKKAISDILYALEQQKENFEERIKEIGNQREFKNKILEEILGKILDSNAADKYSKWFESIENQIEKMMYNLFGDTQLDSIQEYSLLQEDNITYGGNILVEIFNPYSPYSLFIDNIKLACKPQKELIEAIGINNPIRFCLRDTMGLNQVSMNGTDIQEAIDIALNYNPDNILLLISLVEREDVIENCCNKIVKKVNDISKEKKNTFAVKENTDETYRIPIRVLFTKADIFISNIVNKEIRNSIILKQTDYNKYIENVIYRIENSIARYTRKLNKEDTDWLSLRYLEYTIDPIQIALKQYMPDKLSKFQPEGLYQKIYDMIHSMQKHMLPKGIKEPISVTVKDVEKPVIDVKINIESDFIKRGLEYLRVYLINFNTPSYIIPEDEVVYWSSVKAYYTKLQKGKKHKTRSKYYYNFEIDMKNLLLNGLILVWQMYICTLEDITDKLLFSIDNLQQAEFNRIMNILQNNQNIICNSDMYNSNSSDLLQIKLYDIFTKIIIKNAFDIINKIAFNLSYGNKQIKEAIDEAYQSSDNFSTKIKNMQNRYKEMFSSKEFKEIVVEEFNATITETINKIFIVI